MRITKDLDEDIAGRAVIVVEDIIDTGLTLNYLLGVLRSRGPASLEVCVLLDKDVRRIVDLPDRVPRVLDTRPLRRRVRPRPPSAAAQPALHRRTAAGGDRVGMRRRLLIALALVAAVLVAGTIGYVVDRGVAAARRAVHDGHHRRHGRLPRGAAAVRRRQGRSPWRSILGGVGAIGFAFATVRRLPRRGPSAGITWRRSA